MPVDPSFDHVRSKAASMVSELLHLTDLSADALFGLAVEVLGSSRTGLCLAIARLAPLSRRSIVTSEVAELILGTRTLGESWWTRSHEEMVIDRDRIGSYPVRWEGRGAPDLLLAAGQAEATVSSFRSSTLTILGNWISDDAANARWGRPVDFVDLNDGGGTDRILLPPSAQAGDRFVASFDPGHRIWVDVVEWNEIPDPEAERMGLRRGRIGTRLNGHEIDDVNNVGWAWAIATDGGPIWLPGESIGGPDDPFDVAIESSVSDELYEWAGANGAEPELLGDRWTNKGEIWTARGRLGLPYRKGSWPYFNRAVSAIVDGNSDELRDAMALLE